MTRRYREIILHAGPGKTGSTSIQRNCHKHRDLLAAHGFIYPGFDLNGRHLINHSDAITGAVCDPPTKYGMGWRQGAKADPEGARAQLRAQWDPLLANPQGDKLILSGENVAEYKDRDMQALREALLPYCDRLRVVAFIRSPQSSLESILQQRVKGGMAVTPKSILGLVKKRYVNLKRNFSDELEVVNFHDAIKHPRGLVGFFMAHCGLPEAALPEDDFSSSNERMSIEAFGLMFAINSLYPRRRTKEHGIQRHPRDLLPIKRLPGEPFQVAGLFDSALGREIEAEGRWLEQELGFSFPPVKQRNLGLLWQEEVVLSVERAIRRLHNDALMETAARHLQNEVRQFRWRRRDTGIALGYIAHRLLRGKAVRDGTYADMDELMKLAKPWYATQLRSRHPVLGRLLSAISRP